MTQSRERSGGTSRSRLITFRLSDVPLDVRIAAARRVARDEIDRATDPLVAVFEGTKLDAVARDPETAAVTMPAECRNSMRQVTLEEWETAMNPRRWKALG